MIMKKDTGWSHNPPRTHITMKAPVMVRLIKLVTSQIFDYFHGCDHIVTVNIQFDVAEPVIPVALIDSHSFYIVIVELVNGDLAFYVITVPGYDHPFIFHHSLFKGSSAFAGPSPFAGSSGLPASSDLAGSSAFAGSTAFAGSAAFAASSVKLLEMSPLLFPKIRSRSSLKMTSFSSSCSASFVRPVIFAEMTSLALLYDTSTIFFASRSISSAVFSLYGLVKPYSDCPDES